MSMQVLNQAPENLICVVLPTPLHQFLCFTAHALPNHDDVMCGHVPRTSQKQNCIMGGLLVCMARR